MAIYKVPDKKFAKKPVRKKGVSFRGHRASAAPVVVTRPEPRMRHGTAAPAIQIRSDGNGIRCTVVAPKGPRTALGSSPLSKIIEQSRKQIKHHTLFGFGQAETEKKSPQKSTRKAAPSVKKDEPLEESASKIRRKVVEKDIAAHDEQNLQKIKDALDSGRINEEAAEYLSAVYANSKKRCRDFFIALEEYLGEPTAEVRVYDYETAGPVGAPVRLSDVSPLNAYVTQYQFDGDPMRNLFSKRDYKNSKTEMLVSSMVDVIIGKQKSVDRVLEKLTGKRYKEYSREVLRCSKSVIKSSIGIQSLTDCTVAQIELKFKNKFITDAYATVSEVIDHVYEQMTESQEDNKTSLGFEVNDLVMDFINNKEKRRKMLGDLATELKLITKPHLRLRDVWRAKCLFDMVPQARAFAQYLQTFNRTEEFSDTFNNKDYHGGRNYRDIKFFMNLDPVGRKNPIEIICQVRTFFNAEKNSHGDFEQLRCGTTQECDANQCKQNLAKVSAMHECWIRRYNQKICNYTGLLFNHIWWKIPCDQESYSNLKSPLEGFPELGPMGCEFEEENAVIRKVNKAIKDKKLTILEPGDGKMGQLYQTEVLHYMTRFILSSVITPGKMAMRCQMQDNVCQAGSTWCEEKAIKGLPKESKKLFDLVITELQKFYR
ncbi:MAG: hypothetical protein FWG39_01775 [Alphaproteobacteria bacterium]|nr:hypothetical protein [Alphaproteobacteria bacterium]